MRPSSWIIVVLVGAVVGLVFAGVSTYDFVQHLDRQVHALHCSFLPGIGKDAGATGCQAAMMSPYSSVLRTQVWGGIPIALPAMSVFAFLAFLAIDLTVTRRRNDARATGFLVLAAAVPMITSIVMFAIAVTQVGELCKLCVGVYVASTLCMVGAIGAFREARRGGRSGSASEGTSASSASDDRLASEVTAPPASNGFLGAMAGMGVAFVAVPLALYLATAPDNARFIGTCEGLVQPDDTYGVMMRARKSVEGKATPAIEILDPLCPACKAFEQRLDSSGFATKLDRKVVLFPLDNTCNWMVSDATHPGACTVSEAVLCAGDRAPEVLAWAFEEQERIIAQTKADPAAAARIVKQRFPELSACVGSPDARGRLNRSLRWSVANNIRVLTPQLFVGGVKLCDEDVNLGLDFALSTMLERYGRGALVAAPVPGAAPAAQAKPVEPAPSAPGRTAPAAPVAPVKTTPVTSPTSGSAEAQPSATDKPATENPADKPATDPIGDKPTGQPAADKPLDKPAPDKPAPDKPAPDKPQDSPPPSAPAPSTPPATGSGASPGGAS